MGLLLGIAAELNIPIVAMVDAAVCATRRHYEHAVPVHIDLSLHSSLLTRLTQEGQAQVDRNIVIDDNGMLRLLDALAEGYRRGIRTAVAFRPACTRRKPNKCCVTACLAGCGRHAGAQKVAVDLEHHGMTHHAEIESLEFVAAAAPVYQAIVNSLRALFRSEEMPAIQLSARAGGLPGLAETLKARVGGQVFLLETGATARGLIHRCKSTRQSGGLTLSRHMPWDQSPVSVVAGDSGRNGGKPTHLLFGHNAYRLQGRPLVLGSQRSETERWLDLQQEMPGVSRRHCVVSADNGQYVVTDHSRYGTFLNGHRIDGSAVLQTGDLIRIGTPGFELRLIAVESADGT